MSAQNPSPSLTSEISPVSSPTINPPAQATTQPNALGQLLDSIEKDLQHVEKASTELEDYGDRIRKQITEYGETFSTQIRKAKDKLEDLRDSVDRGKDPGQKVIEDFKIGVRKLKLLILSKYKPVPANESDAQRRRWLKDSTFGTQYDLKKEQATMPVLFKHDRFLGSSEFKDFKRVYDGLGIRDKVCLLSFSVFPENEIIRKRFMTYWWIGEGFVYPTTRTDSEPAEQLAKKVYEGLMEKGFIEPIYKSRRFEVKKCRMNPFVRAAVVFLADRAKMFDFDYRGKAISGSLVDSDSENRGNTTSEGSNSGDSNFRKRTYNGASVLVEEQWDQSNQDLEKVHILFNVDVRILEFEKPELFMKMKNINVLCLGRWQTSPVHHIEVEDTKFLEGLRNMKHLKFLSLQGISRITELPPSILNLGSLLILDLRACHNLERIPEKNGFLRSLTHLDMSECYLLDNMRKGLSTLTELEVLKGFVVGDDKKGRNSCTLSHLAKFPKLRKLRIYTGRRDFPTEEELRDLNKFPKLEKLTVEWGGGSQVKPEDKGDKSRNQKDGSNGADHKKDEGKSEASNPTEQENVGKVDAKQENVGTSSMGKEKNAGKSDSADTEEIQNEGGDKRPVDSGGRPATEAAEQENPHTVSIEVDSQNQEDRSKSSNNVKSQNDGLDRRKDNNGGKPAAKPELPNMLEKLDLHCFPQVYARNWLKACKLDKLKKLYIRGGETSRSGSI